VSLPPITVRQVGWSSVVNSPCASKKRMKSAAGYNAASRGEQLQIRPAIGSR
jgi:hypothetical protein